MPINLTNDISMLNLTRTVTDPSRNARRLMKRFVGIVYVWFGSSLG